MKAPNITPGKWMLDDGFLRSQDMAESLLDPDNERWVAIGYADEDGYAASVAYAHPDNAPAISAIPDSHKAMEQALYSLRDAVGDAEELGFVARADSHRESIASIEAALTKAGYTF